MAAHHPLANVSAGVAGVTRSVGEALRARGCSVDYFGFEQAYPCRQPRGVWSQVQFPWRLASYLLRRARHHDVVDVSIGDAWVWLMIRRMIGQPVPIVVTRSHGLEHLADIRTRDAVARGLEKPLSLKYPIYHGGYRLWEVARSMKMADECLFLNDVERSFAVDQLKIGEARSHVLPNGLAENFFNHQRAPQPTAGPLRLVYIGGWLTIKGSNTLVETVARLAGKVSFTLTLLGTQRSDVEVLGAFSPDVRGQLANRPSFNNSELPAILDEQDILVFPSRSEGFGIALIEAMVRGVAPVSTPVGVASLVITPGVNGMIVPVGDSAGMAEAIRQLDADRQLLLQCRRSAMAIGRQFSWDEIATRVHAIYAGALARKR
jgi:glycosyltransferase involved in cell wall biosynthesis